MSLNKVILVGNLGRDPESKQIQGGILCNLSLAVSEKFKGRDGQKQERTEWINIVCFGKLAEICMKYVTKASSVLVEGKLQTRSWEDKDGKKVYRTEVVASKVEFLGKPQSGDRTEATFDLSDTGVDDEQIPF